MPSFAFRRGLVKIMGVAAFPIPENEAGRLELLRAYQIVGTNAEPEYDRFARLAATLFKVPVALLTFVDADRVWLKARSGLELTELDRGDAFCAHTIMQDDVLVIPDTQDDARFTANPFVCGPPHIRFFAGAPLVPSRGHAVGTLCILDTAPRPALTDGERKILADLASMVVDRLENRRLVAAERDAQARFIKIAATSPDAVICADDEGRILFWNDAATRIFGHPAQTIVGQQHTILVPPDARPGLTKWMAGLGPLRAEARLKRTAELEARLKGNAELVCQRADGSTFPAEVSYSSWEESKGVLLCGIIRDVSARREAEAKLRQLASTDSLSGLANRTAFLERLERALQTGRRRRNPAGCALLLIDLDRFKEVNDALGHGVGDRLLQAIARRLRALSGDTVHTARLSGDEFTVIIEHSGKIDGAMELAERVRLSLRKPLRIHGNQIDVGASIGVATYPEHASTANDLLANADLALYQAKADGGDRCVAFVSTLRDVALGRRQIETELRRAHRLHEFVLYYQPQVSIHDGAIIGAEALLRWNHPQQQILEPSRFVSVLETSPLATLVGTWVIDAAIEQAARWLPLTGGDFRIGVNLFASQFVDGDLAPTVTAALARHRLPPECLELEITENIALRHETGAATSLRLLIDAGVGVAFDDFGTGYGSLTYLKRVPVTRLKIDRGFVRNILTDSEDVAIVRAVIALGRSLGLGVTAEGIETEAQRGLLDALGCPDGQGFLFGKPMPERKFTRLLSRSSRQVA